VVAAGCVPADAAVGPDVELEVQRRVAADVTAGKRGVDDELAAGEVDAFRRDER